VPRALRPGLLALTLLAAAPPCLADPAGEARPCAAEIRVNRTGIPLPDASIELIAPDGAAERRIARTDHTGVARFTGLPPGTYRVSGASRGLALQRGDELTCQGRGERLAGSLAFFDAAVQVRVRVRDATGGPLPGARVIALRARTPKHRGESATYLTDASGQAEFGLDQEAPLYDVLAEEPDHLAASAAVPGKRRDVRLELVLGRLEPLRALVVTADGRPAAGAQVELVQTPHRATGRTDPAGAVQLEAGPGALRVGAHLGGLWGQASLPAGAPGPAGREVRVELAAGRALRGVVRVEDGSPVVLAEVRYEVEGWPMSGSVRADARGEFLIDGLPPDLEVALWLRGDKRGPERSRTLVRPGEQPIVLLFVPDP
jgi:hypothetical protein